MHRFGSSYHARVSEGVNPFKSVAGYALPKLIFCRIQGEFLQKLTFCTISFRWTNPFLHSGVERAQQEREACSEFADSSSSF